MADDDFANALAQRYADMHSAGDLRNRLAGDPSIPPPTPYENIMDQSRSSVSGMMRADPVEIAMGLLGPRFRVPNPMRAATAVPAPARAGNGEAPWWRTQADALGARAAERAGATEAEVPAQAAYMFGDRMFTGPHHFAAQDKAYAALGDEVGDALAASGKVRDGFITNKIDPATGMGRFISRDQASRMLEGKPGSGYTSEEAWAKLLDMSQAARSARAREAGFGPEIYYQGRETRYPGNRDVQYVTPNPRAASMFADSSLAQKGVDGGHVIPMRVNREGFADLTNKEHREAIAAQMARVLTEARPAHYEPVTTADALRMLDEGVTNGRAQWQNDTIINAARDAGFPGIPVHENWAQWGWPDAHSLAVFDRSRLRSPNAAFDPANRNSENLLASLTGAAALPGLALLGRSTGEEPQQ